MPALREYIGWDGCWWPKSPSQPIRNLLICMHICHHLVSSLSGSRQWMAEILFLEGNKSRDSCSGLYAKKWKIFNPNSPSVLWDHHFQESEKPSFPCS